MSRRFIHLIAATVVALCIPFVVALVPVSAPPFPATVFSVSTVDPQRPIQSLYVIEQRAATVGWDASSAHAAGDMWSLLGDEHRALSYWEQSLAADPSNHSLLIRLADSYWEHARWSSALVMLSRALESDPNDDAIRLRLGILQAIFDPTSAADTLSKLSSPMESVLLEAQGDTSDVVRLMRVGAALVASENWTAAEAAFEYAASFSPPSGLAFAYWGLARDRVGKNGAQQIEKAVELLPADAQVRYLQGLHLRITNDLGGSLEAFQLAVTLEAENPAYSAELGAAYELAGNLDEAEIWLKRAVTESENDPRFVALLDAFYQRFPAMAD